MQEKQGSYYDCLPISPDINAQKKWNHLIVFRNWLTGVTPCDAMWSFFRPDNTYDCIFRSISEGKDDYYARLDKITFIFVSQKAEWGLTAAQIRVVIPKRCFPKRLSNTFLTLRKKISESGVSQKKKPSVFTGNRRLIPGLRFPEFQGFI